MKPDEIYQESFRLIRERLGQSGAGEAEGQIVERIIHATADWDFASAMQFDPRAVPEALHALTRQAAVIGDVRMALAGFDQTLMQELGVRAWCYVDGKTAQSEALAAGATRSAMGIRRAAEIHGNGAVVVVANAPTALFEVVAQIEQGWRPAVVVGVPVGFVMAKESKVALINNGVVPYIANPTPKGGSPVAAAIVNALLRMAAGRGPW